MKTLHPFLLAALAACGQAVDSAPPAAEAPLFPADAEAVPTPEEAAAEAEKRINAENADAELEKLKKELEDG
jgi:hypothetical protein